MPTTTIIQPPTTEVEMRTTHPVFQPSPNPSGTPESNPDTSTQGPNPGNTPVSGDGEGDTFPLVVILASGIGGLICFLLVLIVITLCLCIAQRHHHQKVKQSFTNGIRMSNIFAGKATNIVSYAN